MLPLSLHVSPAFARVFSFEFFNDYKTRRMFQKVYATYLTYSPSLSLSLYLYLSVFHFTLFFCIDLLSLIKTGW